MEISVSVVEFVDLGHNVVIACTFYIDNFLLNIFTFYIDNKEYKYYQ